VAQYEKTLATPYGLRGQNGVSPFAAFVQLYQTFRCSKLEKNATQSGLAKCL